jgi:hypothetical protein
LNNPRVYLMMDRFYPVRSFDRLKLLMKVEHVVDKLDHTVVTLAVVGIGEVDGLDKGETLS